MLVINSNTQQDTTNYMLSGTWYPDLNSILMWWGPCIIWPNWNFTGKWLDTTPVIDTIGTEKINFYCPKIYQSRLTQWIFSYTNQPVTTTNGWFVCFWVYHTGGGTAITSITWDTTYRIAVKWLKSWQIIWEKIFAPLLFAIPLYSSWNAFIKWTITLTFWLLHSDWTTTQIATWSPTYLWWVWTEYESWRIIKPTASYLSLDATAVWWYTYNWTWQQAQDGDILYATVNIASFKIETFNNGDRTWGLFFGWTESNNIRDILHWFRPFQVSIRE